MAIFVYGLLADTDVEWMARTGEQRRLHDGEILIREGEPTQSVIFLLQGECVVTERAAGDVARLGAGEIVGEMSFLDSAPLGDRKGGRRRSRSLRRQGGAGAEAGGGRRLRVPLLSRRGDLSGRPPARNDATSGPRARPRPDDCRQGRNRFAHVRGRSRSPQPVRSAAQNVGRRALTRAKPQARPVPSFFERLGPWRSRPLELGRRHWAATGSDSSSRVPTHRCHPAARSRRASSMSKRCLALQNRTEIGAPMLKALVLPRVLAFQWASFFAANRSRRSGARSGVGAVIAGSGAGMDNSAVP